MHPYVHCSIIQSGQDMETSKVPLMDDWISGTYIQWTTPP